MHKKTGIIASCSLALLLAITGSIAWRNTVRYAGPREIEPQGNPQLLTALSRQTPLDRKDFESLEGYFQEGFAAYKDQPGSTASYPGLPSSHGHLVDSIEGFTRIAPLMAAYLHSRPDSISQQSIQARQYLLEAWSHGADPNAKGYWGIITDNDQRIVEASDVALSIWLLKDSLWLDLPKSSQENLVHWLLQVNGKKTPDNNWHLFVTYINLVVTSLGYKAEMKQAQEHYARFKSFYRGDGWFSDGPAMRFDYYNAWGIHYQLFWIDQAAPSFDHPFIVSAMNTFAHNLQYLVSPSGLPIMGRSICYRLAITSPLILIQQYAQSDPKLIGESVSPGVARRALAVTWKYFIANGAVSAGRITQGYCGFDARVLDSYSGPASCQWSLRSLVSALYMAPSSPFWTAQEEPLPVELSDYNLTFSQPGWIVTGHKPGGIVIATKSTRDSVNLTLESPLLTTLDHLSGKVHRPDNEQAKYELSQYSSYAPFCKCFH